MYEIGTSLIELLVSIVIFSVVIMSLGPIIQFAFNVNSSYRRATIADLTAKSIIASKKSKPFLEVLKEFKKYPSAISDGESVIVEERYEAQSLATFIVKLSAIRAITSRFPDAVAVEVTVKQKRGVLPEKLSVVRALILPVGIL
jgi:hypothetical protein